MLPEVDQLATVVVCEDDEPTLELLCDHLTADRYRALAAPSASDALRLCHYKSPDLLVLDLMLPDAAGLDVLREIRATDGSNGRYDPSLPVVVLSGRGSAADRVRGFAEGADDYVVDPSVAVRGHGQGCPQVGVRATGTGISTYFRCRGTRARRPRCDRPASPSAILIAEPGFARSPSSVSASRIGPRGRTFSSA